MSDTTLTGQDLYKTIQTLLIPYLKQKKAHYEELQQNITTTFDDYMREQYNPMWESNKDTKDYVNYSDKYDKLTESEKLAIEHIVIENEVGGFADLVLILLYKLIFVALDNANTLEDISRFMNTINQKSLTELKIFMETHTTESIKKTTVGKVYYDIIGAIDVTLSDDKIDKITSIAETTGAITADNKIDYNNKQFLKEVQKLHPTFNAKVVKDGITNRLYIYESNFLKDLEVSREPKYETKIVDIGKNIDHQLGKLIKPWKERELKATNTLQHKQLNSPKYLSDLREDVELSAIVPFFVQKNKLSLLLQFMDTKCQTIEEITTVIKTLSPPSSLFSSFSLFKPKSASQESKTESSGYTESSLADSPDKLFQTKMVRTEPGKFIVGGLHNLHTIPNMYNDYRKRKSRKSRKSRPARKSRKSRKLRTARKLRK